VLALPAHRESEIVPLCELSEATAYLIAEDDGAGSTTGRWREPCARPSRRCGTSSSSASRGVHGSTRVRSRSAGRPDPAEVALFLLSGGTTGTPKLIPRTHDDYLYNARPARSCAGSTSTPSTSSRCRRAQLRLRLPRHPRTFAAGGTVVLSPTPSPDDAFELIEREQVTATAVVPPIALLWMETAEWSDNDLRR